jgi:hypothetical protein
VNDIRRGALLITAAILAARRIALCQSKPSPALECAISDSIIMAAGPFLHASLVAIEAPHELTKSRWRAAFELP